MLISLNDTNFAAALVEDIHEFLEGKFGWRLGQDLVLNVVQIPL